MNTNGNRPDPLQVTSEAVSDPLAEAAIARALSRKPSPFVPDHFAGNVTRLALAQPQPRPSRWLGWGPRLAAASAGLLTLGMFALAPHAAPSLHDVAFDGQLILLAELSCLLLFSHRLLSGE